MYVIMHDCGYGYTPLVCLSAVVYGSSMTFSLKSLTHYIIRTRTNELQLKWYTNALYSIFLCISTHSTKHNQKLHCIFLLPTPTPTSKLAIHWKWHGARRFNRKRHMGTWAHNSFSFFLTQQASLRIWNWMYWLAVLKSPRHKIPLFTMLGYYFTKLHPKLSTENVCVVSC